MMTKSGLFSLASATPFSPSSAKETSNPRLLNISPRRWRSVAESSTTNIFLMPIIRFLFFLSMHDDCFYQTFFVERFKQVLICSDQFAARTIKQRIFAGQHNHGGISEVLVFFDERAGLIAIQAWHHHIHEYDIRLVIHHLGQAVKSVFCKDDLASRLRQEYLTATPYGCLLYTSEA